MGRCGSCWEWKLPSATTGAFSKSSAVSSPLKTRLLHVEVGHALVELDGVGHDRFGEGHVGRQDLEVLLDLLGGRAGVLLGVGGHQGHHVAAPADLLAGDDRELP